MAEMPCLWYDIENNLRLKNIQKQKKSDKK